MLVDRRELLYGMATALAGFARPRLGTAQQAPSGLRINAARLERRLEGLSAYGRPAGGTFADGVSRVAYSDVDVAGRKYAMEAMRNAGLQPRIDPAGNIFAARAGMDLSLPPILFGSHIDSVPNGGNFDGDVGSLSAIEVMQTLEEHQVTTKHPLQVVIWSNEENLVGSPAAAGGLDESVLSRVYNGIRMEEGLRKIGGDPTRLAEARIGPHSFCCYLELHIEQGGTLDKTKIPIGVVEGIVSMNTRWNSADSRITRGQHPCRSGAMPCLRPRSLSKRYKMWLHVSRDDRWGRWDSCRFLPMLTMWCRVW
jgi:beta-ureidopropionase / N-carbamoyl-L-amino-acid hydrolase